MFKDILIVGVGLIGGSLGLALKRKNPDCKITGVSSMSAVKNAVEMGAIDCGFPYEKLEEAVAGKDVVFLCTPINVILEHIERIAHFVEPGTVITDVGSTKRIISEKAAAFFPEGVHFIGGHPMTGSEKSGVNASDPFLFQNAIYVLCPSESTGKEKVDKLSGFLSGIGARIIILDASHHDGIAAAVSHLPQMLAVSLVNSIGSVNYNPGAYLQLAAGGFRDMTRIASSSFSMWDDICRTNEDYIKKVIDSFIISLENLKERIGTPLLKDDFERANLTRASIPKDTKGFLNTLYEILVVVEDKPGVIAAIASVLADKGINIKDIEVLKVREGEGGTLRLAFELEHEADSAIEILKSDGYSTRRRD